MKKTGNSRYEVFILRQKSVSIFKGVYVDKILG